MSPGMVRTLGWLVIAHGLSHAVLPLRGSLAPGYAFNDWMPVGLYLVAMIGFVAAGLGMLGLRPLDCAISPFLVLSSGLSLVAIARLGDPTPWAGGAFDVPLLLIGLWRGYGGWPNHPQHGHRWHLFGLACGFTFLACVATAAVLWPWHRTWGSTRDELTLARPSDEGARNPALSLQRGQRSRGETPC